jgi:predicted nucleic acid-binding protein
MTAGVTGFVDTNVIVRHLTGDPPEQARRATNLLDNVSSLWLADVIVAEVVYVLESVYRVDRDGIAGLMRSIVSSHRMRVSDLPLLLRTIEVYEHHRLAFADAYLVASAERSGVAAVVSFDRGISKVGTVERIEP